MIDMVANGFVVRPTVPDNMPYNKNEMMVFESRDSLLGFIENHFRLNLEPKPE